MKIDSVNSVYFSPTGTTKKIVSDILSGITPSTSIDIDLTLPDGGFQQTDIIDCDLVILGSPVYCSRIPPIVIERLKSLKFAENTPVVLVVVYGNRVIGDALLELKDFACSRGLLPIAAGSFIGEHSFSTQKNPIAVGRPDDEDLSKARDFGETIRNKVNQTGFPDEIRTLTVPGNFPYYKKKILQIESPVTDQERCIKCGKCMKHCPVQAIKMNLFPKTDHDKCIFCSACVKLCPVSVRKNTGPAILELSDSLSQKCVIPKQPEVYY